MGHYPITVLGRWLDYETQCPIAHSLGLQVTTNLNHLVTWIDDYNFSFTMYTDEDVYIYSTHPVYKPRPLRKPPMNGYGGTLDMRGWHLTALAGISVYIFDSFDGTRFDCELALMDTTNYVLHRWGVAGSAYFAVAPGMHRVLGTKNHYKSFQKDVGSVAEQSSRIVHFMQFKGGNLQGRTSIYPAILGDFEALKNGVKVELINDAGKVKRQIITPSTYLPGYYFFKDVPRGTYTIKGTIVVSNAEATIPDDAGTYQAFYNGGGSVVVETSDWLENLDFTLVKI